MLTRLIIVAWAFVAVQPAGAADNTALSPKQRSGLVSKIHDSNLFEMKLGELAKVKGSIRNVRAYGAQLVRDHAFADRRLTRLAEKNQIPIAFPGPWTSEELQDQALTIQKLETASGADFDRSFLDSIKNNHLKTLELFRSAREQLPASPLRTYVSRLRPIMQQHHDLAMKIDIR